MSISITSKLNSVTHSLDFDMLLRFVRARDFKCFLQPFKKASKILLMAKKNREREISFFQKIIHPNETQLIVLFRNQYYAFQILTV